VIIMLTPHIVKDDSVYSEASESIMKGAEKLRVGVRKGMMWFGRERLADSSYEQAVAEMGKPRPDRKKALWHLDCATNLNPKFLEAINLKQSLSGQQIRASDNSSIREFLRQQVLAERAATPTTKPAEELQPAPATPATRPVSTAQAPATQPIASAFDTVWGLFGQVSPQMRSGENQSTTPQPPTKEQMEVAGPLSEEKQVSATPSVTVVELAEPVAAATTQPSTAEADASGSRVTEVSTEELVKPPGADDQP
jgi:hypothetical protein